MQRTDKSAGHVVITGTGRTGTTFLVQLFTFLGFDTGFSREAALASVNRVSRAGLEFSHLQPGRWPYVVKSPRIAQVLQRLLETAQVRVKLVILPVRAAADAAASRIRVSREGERQGGMWLAPTEARQQGALLNVNHTLLCTIARFRVPHVLLHFPTLVQDGDYLFAVLEPMLRDHGVDAAEFAAAFAAVARPDLVHRFDGPGGAEG